MLRSGKANPIRIAAALFGVIALSGGAAQAGENEIDEETLELGRQIFTETAQPPCGICHTLADAETTGTIAPRLDDIQPNVDEARAALIDGPGPMPSYAETLSEEEIEAVSRYVAAVAGAD
jgi:cytochrome c6